MFRHIRNFFIATLAVFLWAVSPVMPAFAQHCGHGGGHFGGGHWGGGHGFYGGHTIGHSLGRGIGIYGYGNGLSYYGASNYYPSYYSGYYNGPDYGCGYSNYYSPNVYYQSYAPINSGVYYPRGVASAPTIAAPPANSYIPDYQNGRNPAPKTPPPPQAVPPKTPPSGGGTYEYDGGPQNPVPMPNENSKANPPVKPRPMAPPVSDGNSPKPEQRKQYLVGFSSAQVPALRTFTKPEFRQATNNPALMPNQHDLLGPQTAVPEVRPVQSDESVPWVAK